MTNLVYCFYDINLKVCKALENSKQQDQRACKPSKLTFLLDILNFLDTELIFKKNTPPFLKHYYYVHTLSKKKRKVVESSYRYRSKKYYYMSNKIMSFNIFPLDNIRKYLMRGSQIE